MEFTGERYVPAITGQIRYEHLHRYALSLEFAAGKTVLDIASGEGYGAALLASVAKSVTGVDIDPATIGHAKHLYNNPKLDFVIGTCDSVPLPNASFDVITSFETIEHHDKHEEMLDEIKRLLRPGGTLIISSPNRLTYSDEPGYKNPFHVKELYYEEFHELLHRRFKSIRMFGQRLAAGSFIFPLTTSDRSHIKPLTGDANGVTDQVCALPSPIYFVAVCSDSVKITKRDVTSVYFDRSDDLLKTLENERIQAIHQMQDQVRRTEEETLREIRQMQDQVRRTEEETLREIQQMQDQVRRTEEETLREIQQMQDQVRRTEEEQLHGIQQMQDQVRRTEEEIERQRKDYERHIAQLTAEMNEARKGYERQILSQIEELNDTRASYTEQLRQRDEVIAQRDAAIVVRDHAVTERDDIIARITAHMGIARRTILDYEKMLSETQSQLVRHIEVVNWIYASRSWRLTNKLRQIERLNERWSRGSGFFEGVLEWSQWSVPNSIEIRGWVRSTAGSVILVEAFLDDLYLGTIRYGVERPDGYAASISLHGLELVGERMLRVRVYDDQGNKRAWSRPIVISAGVAKPIPPEVFKGTLDLPPSGIIVADSLEISGWVYSKAGPVTFVEALLDDTYIGRVSYGEERPDVVKAFPTEAPLRCGYEKTFSLVGLDLEGPKTLKLCVYDASSNTQFIEQPIVIEPPIVALGKKGDRSLISCTSEISDLSPFFPTPQFEELIAEFQNRMERNPSILDWKSGFDLKGTFPDLAVFSPPQEGETLPYLDNSIDIVVTSTSIPEARRVCSGAVVHVAGDSLDVEWRDSVSEPALQTVSIIIPVYNEVNYTQACLDRLSKTLPHNFRGEIVVVDDASSDETPAVLKRCVEADKRIKVFRNAQNAGFIATCNRGAREASGEILIFLNNDTLPMPGWLPPLLRVLRDKPYAGAVGGKLIYPDGTLQEAGAVIFSDGSGCNFGKHDKAPNAPLYNFLRDVDYCSAALLATRRTLFLEFGGFDTRFQPAYYEDADYCFSLRARGYRVYYQPESVVVHFEGASSGTDINTGVKSYQAVNRGKFVEKWGGTLNQQPAPPQQYDPATMQTLSMSRAAANGHGD